ncbi:MAG: hypothetical protein ACRC33_17360 [Gemmataceae bacterium]
MKSIEDPTLLYSIEPYLAYDDGDVGRPDDPAVRPESDVDRPMGTASDFSSWLNGGDYDFWNGNDWWVGPDGHVHST